MLARLLCAPESFVRRLAPTQDDVSPDIAERIQWLVAVVDDLRGAYNDAGIRRWFGRPRAQLGGLSPSQSLREGWHIDDEAVQRVRALARALAGQRPVRGLLAEMDTYVARDDDRV